MSVTKHFSAEEFKQRAWSGGPEELYPAKWLRDRLTPLCEALELLRAELGGPAIHVISGYRSKAFNKSIGGKKLSMHLEGRAADVQVRGVSPAAVYEAMQTLHRKGLALQIRGMGAYDTFCHFDVRPTVRLMTWDEAKSWSPVEA